jgi:exodeoxyribonuclease V beta subunit
MTRVPFRLTQPLPRGTTVLEASAGTGKTWTLAALATLYVAEGVAPVDRLLLVTFSRGATRELRARVRQRMVQAADALRRPAATDDDALLALLGDGTPEVVAERAQRLHAAATSFDAATIATIHQFSHRMLALLGMAGDLGAGETFDASPHDLADDVAEQRLVLALRHDNPGALDDACARALARAVSGGDSQTPLVPRDAPAGSVAAARVDWAAQVRDEVHLRRRLLGRLGYDQQLTRLRDVLTSPDGGPAAVQRLREQFSAVLVDEFQDTDEVQWQILRAFAHDRLPLVLIGDPKQAIYGFRGADVHSYLAAVESSLDHRTLDRNWRSDPGVVCGVQHLLAGVSLGDDRITVAAVEPARRGARLHGVAAPVQVRVLDRDGASGLTKAKLLRADPAREVIRRDLVTQVVALLSGDARLADAAGHRALEPGDIAVLVRVTEQGDHVRAALVAAGVPAVLNAARDVFASPAADDLAALLEALERPSDTRRQRAAMIGPLVGLAPSTLVGDDAAADEAGETLRLWRRTWVERGMLALLDDLVRSGMAARLAQRPDGDRMLTDLRHLAETVHVEAARYRWSTTVQLQWLQRQRARGEMDDSLERSRRLEKDARAVQVMTVHAAKGLEFPVVLLPFEATSQPFEIADDPVLMLHDDDRAVVHVGGADDPGHHAALVTAQHESAGEHDRAHYVALTRAASRLVVWWAPTTVTARSPLHRLLLGQREGSRLPPSVPVPTDAAVWERVAQVADTSGGTVEAVRVRAASVPVPPSWSPPTRPAVTLEVARLERSLDTEWRRTSYTGLVSGQRHEPEAGSEVDEPGTLDEPVDAPGTAQPGEAVAAGESSQARRLRERGSAWADLPAGAWFGTLVHGVLEQVDTAGGDLAGEVRARVDQALAHRAGRPVDADALTRGLLDTLQTPLGPLAGGLRLRDVAPSDRLCELGFELPLAGGDRPGGGDSVVDAALGDVAELLRNQLPHDDPLRRYADAMAVDGLAGRRLRGYLLGSIDAVLRVPHPRLVGESTYLVVDYKTNVLRDDDGTVTPWAYRPGALVPAMVAAHYPLQALLYAVALHRLLRWRLGGRYRPHVHLGGVQYHFVRGMVGPDAVLRDDSGEPTGEVSGVLAWSLPPSLVTAVSDLLATGRTA